MKIESIEEIYGADFKHWNLPLPVELYKKIWLENLHYQKEEIKRIIIEKSIIHGIQGKDRQWTLYKIQKFNTQKERAGRRRAIFNMLQIQHKNLHLTTAENLDLFYDDKLWIEYLEEVVNIYSSMI